MSITSRELRTEFLKSLSVLAPRIAAALEDYGEAVVNVQDLHVAGTATVVGDTSLSGTLLLSSPETGDGDYFSIATTTNGATTINTVDDDAAAANLTLDVDGAFDVNVAADVTIDTAASVHITSTEDVINAISLTSNSIYFTGGDQDDSYLFYSKPLYLDIITTPATTTAKLWCSAGYILNWGGLGLTVTGSGHFNKTGADFDFRVQGNDETHLLFVDAGNNRVSIGDSVDAPAATLEVTNHASAGAFNAPLVQLNSNDTDQICLDINAANIDADIIDIAADAVTTANVMDVTADALTTGGILNLVSDSSATDDRALVSITNDNTAAVRTMLMHLKTDAHNDPDGTGPHLPAVLIECTAADTGEEQMPLLELRNSNASVSGYGSSPLLKFNRSDSSAEADDMDIGRIVFSGVDSANADTTYCQIEAEAVDITNGAEAGCLKFLVQSSAGSGTGLRELFSIRAEDSAAGTQCEVVVNDSSIDSDFRVESDGNTHMLFVDGADNTVAAGGIDATNHKDGLAVFNDFNGTAFESTLADGQFGSAEILRYSPGANDTLTAGQLYFLHTDGTWDQTDADAVATGATQLLGIGLGGSAQTVGVATRGYIRIPSSEILNLPGSGACDGLPVYVSTTAGHLDFTAPTGTGDFVRVVGYAIDDDSSDVLVYINPSATHVELA